MGVPRSQVSPRAFDKKVSIVGSEDPVKRFHFRLERLLKVKQQQERLAEQRQELARAAFEVARAEVVRAEERVADAGGGGLAALQQSAAIGAWQARYEQVAALGRALEAARRRAQFMEQQFEETRQARAKIATEVEALLLLRRQQWECHQEEGERRAQDLLDDVGLRRWLAAQARAGDNDAPQGEER